jgi:hypothetical protein
LFTFTLVFFWLCKLFCLPRSSFFLTWLVNILKSLSHCHFLWEMSLYFLIKSAPIFIHALRFVYFSFITSQSFSLIFSDYFIDVIYIH